MNGKRQKSFKQDSHLDNRGESLSTKLRGIEPLIAESKPESPTGTRMLMEAIFERENLVRALKRVKANKGSPGVDGMDVDELSVYLKNNWMKIKGQLLTGTYKPNPVKRVEIPKPDGGKRQLGIPTVVDRFIQQAILQVIQPKYDKTFSESSYGFRPGRSAHQAMVRAQKHISDGYRYVVDIDLEKFFDKVNHDRLMSRLAKGIEDKRLLKVIRAYLNAGVMEDGLVKQRREGTPQGGPLSPLLSNIVLDELDKELERRGHRFVRYADDNNIYVRSERAGKRVMDSITCYIEQKLKLKVNQVKSAVDKPSRRKFLGYSFTNGTNPRIRISPKSLKVFKERIRNITRRKRGIGLEQMVKELIKYMKGWMGYYRLCQTLSVLKILDSWIRRRIRCFIWKKWRTYKRRASELIKGGVRREWAYGTAYSSKGCWVASDNESIHMALSNAYIQSLGIVALSTLVNV